MYSSMTSVHSIALVCGGRSADGGRWHVSNRTPHTAHIVFLISANGHWPFCSLSHASNRWDEAFVVRLVLSYSMLIVNLTVFDEIYCKFTYFNE